MLNDFFSYDPHTGKIEIIKPEILLIKEFADLLEPNRNKCKEDPKGTKSLRAFRELSYIWLALSWQSPLKDYYEQDRHREALASSGLTEKEFNDPVFREACRKFKKIQDENRSIKMLKAAQTMVDKFIDYFLNVDPEERDPITGKPVFKVESLQKEISNIHKVHEELVILESQVKKELAESSTLRAGARDGYHPTF